MPFLVVVAFLFLDLNYSHGQTPLKVATLEWPPFICSECPGQGIAAKALKEALAKKNITIEFHFTSWTQAVREGAGKEFLGYFPAWKREALPGFFVSSPVFSSPLGFVELKKRPLKWETLSDLKAKRIGGAKDYKYPEEFMELANKGHFRYEEVVSDDTNLRRLATGKLDGAIIDINNARYLLKNSSKQVSKNVQVSEKIIKRENLYLIVNPHHQSKLSTVNEAIKSHNTEKVIEKSLPKP